MPDVIVNKGSDLDCLGELILAWLDKGIKEEGEE